MISLATYVAETLTPLHSPSRSADAAPSVASSRPDRRTIEEVREALGWLNPNDRDLWQKNGHRLKDWGDTGYALWLEWSKKSVLFEQSDADHKWGSFKPTNTSYKAIFADAMKAGWPNPGRVWGVSVDGVSFDHITSKAASSDWPEITPITQNEWDTSETSPPCVIDNLLYNDVGLFIAAGGASKTTVIIWIFIHIVLGMEFCGRKIIRRGNVVIVTAEDSRGILIARLRRIAETMFAHGTIDPDERQSRVNAIMAGVIILDVTARPQRLTQIERDSVRVNEPVVSALIDRIKPYAPSFVVFDPAVSMGVGEGRTNDAEQALIEAGRMIVRAVACPVAYVHHTGKENARNGTDDQYSSRGGSAFVDGARLVLVMKKMMPNDWATDTGNPLEPGEMGLKITIAKNSYSAPQKPMYVIRNGYRFKHIEANAASDDEKVIEFIRAEGEKGTTFSRAALANARERVGLSRDDIRSSVARLIASGRLIDEIGPKNSHKLVIGSVAETARDTEGGGA